MSIALSPKLLLLDEPTSSQDHVTTLLIEQMLVHTSDVACVWATHDIEQQRRIGGHVLELGRPTAAPIEPLPSLGEVSVHLDDQTTHQRTLSDDDVSTEQENNESTTEGGVSGGPSPSEMDLSSNDERGVDTPLIEEGRAGEGGRGGRESKGW